MENERENPGDWLRKLWVLWQAMKRCREFVAEIPWDGVDTTGSVRSLTSFRDDSLGLWDDSLGLFGMTV